jgi:uncharacterized protein YndB with AHSA1/START domain
MDRNEFVYATYIRTTPEKLWEALTKGDFSEKYWFGFRIELQLRAVELFISSRQKGWNSMATMRARWAVDHRHKRTSRSGQDFGILGRPMD